MKTFILFCVWMAIFLTMQFALSFVPFVSEFFKGMFCAIVAIRTMDAASDFLQ